MSAHSLLLDTDTWDLTLDAGGGIATTSGAYAIAQNVANAVRLFTEDAYYDQDRGIPHFAIELKAHPALSILRARIKQAAEAVEGVQSAEVVDLDLDMQTRNLSGYISLTLTDGTTANVNL